MAKWFYCTSKKQNWYVMIYPLKRYVLFDQITTSHLPWYDFMMHDDVIKWIHFPFYWPFVRGIHRSPVSSPHQSQWPGALMFFICSWIHGWVNNREAGDLRRHRARYGVSVMYKNTFDYATFIDSGVGTATKIHPVVTFGQVWCNPIRCRARWDTSSWDASLLCQPPTFYDAYLLLYFVCYHAHLPQNNVCGQKHNREVDKCTYNIAYIDYFMLNNYCQHPFLGHPVSRKGTPICFPERADQYTFPIDHPFPYQLAIKYNMHPHQFDTYIQIKHNCKIRASIWTKQ